MAVADREPFEFGVAEYDRAVERFFGVAVRAIMEAQKGVYSLVTKEPIEQIPDYSLNLPDAAPLKGRPMEASTLATINRADVVEGNFDSVLAAIYSMAIDLESQIGTSIMAHISEVCDSTGNVISAKLSYDSVIDAIENMEFSFNEQGEPNITVVASPEGVERLRALGDPTPEQRARLDDIISRRRDEWNARRSSRSLPSRRN